MMKIKLLKIPYCETGVNEGDTHTKYPSIPLGLPLLTSILKKNGFKVDQDDLNVKVFRQNLKENTINLALFSDERKVNSFIRKKSNSEIESESLKIIDLTKHKGFDLFAFSIEDAVNNIPTLGIISSLSRFIKEMYSVPIVGGGKIPYEVIHKLLLNKVIDYWLTEGPYSNQQQAFVEFCKRFEQRSFSPCKFPHIVYSYGGKIKSTETFFKEDEFVTPDFDGLPLELYKRNNKININGRIVIDDLLVLPYFFVKGCPYKCAFCSNSTSNYWKTQNSEIVAEDLKFLSKKYKTKYFYFLNSAINPTKNYVNSIAKSFIEKDMGIFFTDCANFKCMDEKILIKLKEAGAIRLIYGLETVSPRLLKYINKDIPIEMAQKLFKKTYDLGIWGEIELIIGLPYETEKDVKKTIEFVEKNKKYIQQVNLFKFWLDGRFLKYPNKFGLRLLFEDKEKRYLSGNRKGFDEIKGLSWEEKIKQTDDSYNKLMKLCKTNEFGESSLIPNLPLSKSLFIAHVIGFMYNK